MKQKGDSAGADRRSFSKLAGLGTDAGGAALVAGQAPTEAREATAEDSGYRESDHIRTYYELARF